MRVGIQILQEQIERRDPLRQAALENVPFSSGQQTRDQVIRKNSLGALVLTVDRKRDPLVEERHIGSGLSLPQLLWIYRAQALAQSRVVVARDAAAVEHLVVRLSDRIAAKLRQVRQPIQRTGFEIGNRRHGRKTLCGKRRAVKRYGCVPFVAGDIVREIRRKMHAS
jgi:hypothetical protein